MCDTLKNHSGRLILMVYVLKLSLICGCDDSRSAIGHATTKPVSHLILNAKTPSTGFVLHRHESENIILYAPSNWFYSEQPFLRQNDVLVGLFPPGAIPSDLSATRLYLHGHALPDGITFDDYIKGHEFGSFAKDHSAKFLASNPAQLNGVEAHRWVSTGQLANGIRMKWLTVAAIKGSTVYHATFRAPPEEYDRLAEVAEQIICSIVVGEPKNWPTPPPPAIPRKN